MQSVQWTAVNINNSLPKLQEEQRLETLMPLDHKTQGFSVIIGTATKKIMFLTQISVFRLSVTEYFQPFPPQS